MGSGPRTVHEKRFSEHPLLLCIERKSLETSILSNYFPKQNNSTSNSMQIRY